MRGKGGGLLHGLLDGSSVFALGERWKELDLWTPAHQVVHLCWQCKDCGRPCASECASFKRGRWEQNCWVWCKYFLLLFCGFSFLKGSVAISGSKLEEFVCGVYVGRKGE